MPHKQSEDTSAPLAPKAEGLEQAQAKPAPHMSHGRLCWPAGTIRKPGIPTKEFLLQHMRLNESTSCWEWTRHTLPKTNQGIITVNNKHQLVHRVAYQLWVGPIPLGKLVCHSCDNPPCFNPSHLFTGTNKGNTQDAITKGRLKCGEAMHNHRLTALVVIELRSRYKPGVISIRKLAEEFGVGYATAYWAIHRKTWKHIP